MARLYRFIGDVAGYKVEEDQPDTGWVDAHVGSTSVKCRVNVDQAYLVCDYGAWDVAPRMLVSAG
jgi:hypothetical protein